MIGLRDCCYAANSPQGCLGVIPGEILEVTVKTKGEALLGTVKFVHDGIVIHWRTSARLRGSWIGVDR